MVNMMKSSLTSWRLIKAFEGFREKAEQTVNGKWVIGYGHIKSAKANIRITPEEGHLLLRFDLQTIEKTLNANLHTIVSQNQFDALVSLIFNIGEENFLQSEILKRLNAGEILHAAQAFDIWRQAKIGGKLQLIDALVRRRSAEKALFLSPDRGVLEASAKNLDIHPDLSYALRLGILSEKSEHSAMDHTIKGLSERFAGLETKLSPPKKENTEWPEIDIEKLDSDKKASFPQTEQTENKEKDTSEKGFLFFNQEQTIKQQSIDITKQKPEAMVSSQPQKQTAEQNKNSYFQKIDLSKNGISDFEAVSTVLEKANTQSENNILKQSEALTEETVLTINPLISEKIFFLLTLSGILLTVSGFLIYISPDLLSFISTRFAVIAMLSGILISIVSLYFWYRNHSKKSHDTDYQDHDGGASGNKRNFKGTQKKLRNEVKLEDKGLRNRLQNLVNVQKASGSSPLNHI